MSIDQFDLSIEPMKVVNDFLEKKESGEKIVMITCYDYSSARIVNTSDIDAILVGDSAAMVIHGFETTVNATMEMMTSHVRAVRKGAPDKFLVADMPFLMHRKGRELAMSAVDEFVRAGAQAVKIEGARGHLDLIQYIVESGIPVMGHLGLTPQSVHQLGGYRVQGKGKDADKLWKDAKALQEARVFSLVLELVPASLAKRITEDLTIPTIGIGAGPETSGQVLVFQDLLGMNPNFKPKFLRTYLDGYHQIQSALNNFSADVKNGRFPSKEESF